MIRTMGGRIATREQLERFSLSVADLGPGPWAKRKPKAKRVAVPVSAPVPQRLCRECDREADVRNYGPYCSRACAKAGLGE